MNRTGWKLGWSLFARKWRAQMVIMLLLAVALIFINVLTGIIYQASAAQRLFGGFSDKTKAAFFMPQDDSAAQGVWNELRHATYEPASFKFSQDGYGRNFTLMLYGERTAAGLHTPLKEEAGEYIPCAASAPYRVGDIIKTLYYNQVAVMQVVTLLREDAPYLNFSNTSNAPTFQMVCGCAAEGDKPVVLVCREYMPRSTPIRTQFNAVVFFDEEDAADVARLQNAGWVVTLAEVEKNSRQETAAYLSVYMPVVLAVFLIGMVSFVGILMVLVLRQMRTFVIFQICGMSRWQFGCIGRAYGAILSLGAGLLATVGWLIVGDALLSAGELSWINGAVTLLLLALPVLLSDWLPRRLIPQDSPLKTLTNSEAIL